MQLRGMKRAKPFLTFFPGNDSVSDNLLLKLPPVSKQKMSKRLKENNNYVLQFSSYRERQFPRCYTLKTLKFVSSNCCVLERWHVKFRQLRLKLIEEEVSKFDMLVL